MSEADKMFEALGFKKFVFKISLQYIYNYHKVIKFNKFSKSISCNEGFEHGDITMGELEAINKKCEELGWLDKE